MHEHGTFRTTEETPTLDACLTYAKEQIQIIYKIRVPLLNKDVTFESEWEAIYAGVIDDPDTATRLDDNFEFLKNRGYLPEVYVLIRAAIALWLEALRAYQLYDHERAWAALTRCNYYLGMSSGHETKKERSARGGRHAAARTARLKERIIKELNEMKDNSYQTKQDVWNVLLPIMSEPTPENKIDDDEWVRRLGLSSVESYQESFDRPAQLGKSKAGKSTNPTQLLRRWTNQDATIKSEFIRIVARPLNTRRMRT